MAVILRMTTNIVWTEAVANIGKANEATHI